VYSPNIHAQIYFNPYFSKKKSPSFPTFPQKSQNLLKNIENWVGGTLKLIKTIGIHSRFTLIEKKAQEQKWLKNYFSPVLNPDTS